jgi:hypothetical protein
MKVFSPSLKLQMKACILAVLWPRKAICEFLRNCSVPLSILKTVENWDAKGLSRSAIVDQVFDSLSNRADNGTMHFNLMLEALSEWSYFDDYWFNREQKLDLDDAKKKISALKLARTNHIEKVKKRAEDHRASSKAREARHASLDEMRRDFQAVCLTSGTPQARGYAFEKFLAKDGAVL